MPDSHAPQPKSPAPRDPMPAPEETVRRCEAWDLGYPATCVNPARWKAEKHQAVPFVLCGRHLHRARRAHYSVYEIGASV